MDIAFLPFDQLFEVEHFITALEKIDMNSRPLLSHFALSEKSLKGISVLGVRVQLKQGRINSVLFFSVFHLKNWKSSAGGRYCPQGILLHLHSMWSINVC